MNLALFSLDLPENFIAKLCDVVDKPVSEIKIAYIITPANYKDSIPSWISNPKLVLEKYGINVRYFDLEEQYKDGSDLLKVYSSYDIIFVSGGNVTLFMYWAIKTKFNFFLREWLRNKNKVYMGASAGAVAIGPEIKIFQVPEIEDVSKAPEVVGKGLNLVDWTIIPHWNETEEQELFVQIANSLEKDNIKFYTLSNNQAIFFDGDNAEQFDCN